MLTDVEYYGKERSLTQYPQKKIIHLSNYDVVMQDQHYSDLICLASRFRYNRLMRFKTFLLNSLMNRNQMAQSTIDGYLRVMREQIPLQPLRVSNKRMNGGIEFPCSRKVQEQLKIQKEKNAKLMKHIKRYSNLENEQYSLTTE